MRTAAFALVAALCGTAGAQALPPAPSVAALLAQPATPGVDPQARRSAIAAVLAEQPGPAREAAPALSARGAELERFERLVDEATVPDCLHADGLKRQPAQIGPIGLGGVLGLPFVALAAMRGKCQLR